MILSKNFSQSLKTKAHQLKPVVRIGQKGLTDNIHQEVDLALLKHELIKVQVLAPTKELQKEYIDTIREKSTSRIIQTIGNILVLYRKKPD